MGHQGVARHPQGAKGVAEPTPSGYRGWLGQPQGAKGVPVANLFFFFGLFLLFF